jgi:cytochrome c oxidase subunit IV
MAERHPNYMAIFYFLLVLTVVEIGFTFLPLSKFAIGVLLVAAAVSKAALVALYFMHLRFEVKTLSLIAFTPMVICVFLVFMLLPDVGDADLKLKKASTQSTQQMQKKH